MITKLTPRQNQVLSDIYHGKTAHRISSRKTLDSLERLGLVKLHVPIGWSITSSGISAIAKATGESE